MMNSPMHRLRRPAVLASGHQGEHAAYPAAKRCVACQENTERLEKGRK